MNLGKLLWVGKSIFGGGEKAAYRLSRRAGLPKFNVGRNPFGRPAPEAPAPAAAQAPAAPSVTTAPKPPPPYAFKPKTRVMAAPQPAPAKPARPGWTTRLNPFRAAEPPAAHPQPAAVQPELSLNSVKVVHNDLADADVEVVPAKSHTGPVETPVLPPARRAWEYMGEQLLKG